MRTRGTGAVEIAGETPLPRRAPRPGTERAFYADYEVVAAQGVVAYRAAIRRALAPDRPIAEAAAALRVAQDLGIGAPFEFLELAVTAPRVRIELRDFALQRLINHARVDTARAALIRILQRGPSVERHRAEANHAVIEYGSEAEIRATVSRLYAEKKPGVASRAARALADSKEYIAAGLLEELRVRHPVAAVRAAVAKCCAEAR